MKNMKKHITSLFVLLKKCDFFYSNTNDFEQVRLRGAKPVCHICQDKKSHLNNSTLLIKSQLTKLALGNEVPRYSRASYLFFLRGISLLFLNKTFFICLESKI